MNTGEQPVVNVQNLWAGYGPPGKWVVRDISFDIPKARVMCLVGASGTGKTTTGRAIAGGLDRAWYKGIIQVDGMSPADLSREAMRRYRGGVVGMITQDPEQYFDPLFKTGSQLTTAVCDHIDISRKEARSALIEALGELGISNPPAVMDAYPHELSGGMKARAAIALSLVLKPALIVADEVTSALDPVMAIRVLDLLKGLVSGPVASVLLITHDLIAALRIGDHVAVMCRGRIVEKGPVHIVLTHPMHPYTRLLLDAHLMNADALNVLDETTTHGPPGNECPFISRCPVRRETCKDWHFRVYPGPGNRLVACPYPLEPTR